MVHYNKTEPSILPIRRRQNENILTLDPDTWIAKGSKRFVYQHPQDKGLVLKVQHKKPLGETLWRQLRISDDLKEAYWCRRIHAAHPGTPFVPRVFGFIHTNLGPALVEERVCNTNSSRALRPSVFVRNLGNAEAVTRTVTDLFRFLETNHIVCNDISDQNILVRTEKKKLQAVVIDGFGNNHLIPYASMSARMNRRKLERKKQRVLRKIDREEKVTRLGDCKSEN
jgi:hypothetical protein